MVRLHDQERLHLPAAAERVLRSDPEDVRRQAADLYRRHGEPAANQAQIAAAVTDATCTESADLAGIYFAVQASYEQQIVNANQQALNSAVQQYKAAYVTELKKLPSLLKTAKANKFPKIRPTRKG